MVSRIATTRTAGKSVIVQCVKDGAKLRIRVVSDGYNQAWNCRFPRALRVTGARYVMDEIREAQGHYPNGVGIADEDVGAPGSGA